MTVLFGGADGRIGEGERRVLTQRDLGRDSGVGGPFRLVGQHLFVLVLGTACYGLMIGAPGEDVDGHEDAGMAHVFLINSGPEGEPPQRRGHHRRPVRGGWHGRDWG